MIKLTDKKKKTTTPFPSSLWVPFSSYNLKHPDTVKVWGAVCCSHSRSYIIQETLAGNECSVSRLLPQHLGLTRLRQKAHKEELRWGKSTGEAGQTPINHTPWFSCLVQCSIFFLEVLLSNNLGFTEQEAFTAYPTLGLVVQGCVGWVCFVSVSSQRAFSKAYKEIK